MIIQSEKQIATIMMIPDQIFWLIVRGGSGGSGVTIGTWAVASVACFVDSSGVLFVFSIIKVFEGLLIRLISSKKLALAAFHVTIGEIGFYPLAVNMQCNIFFATGLVRAIAELKMIYQPESFN